MRVLRSTMYPPPGSSGPMTTVVRDSDVIKSLEEVAAHSVSGNPRMFVTTEIFDMPGGSIEAATRRATALWNQRRQREENMALLFYWNSAQIEQNKKPGRVLIIKNDQGAPLSVDEISYALQQLARLYPKDVRVDTFFRENGVVVYLDDGVVSVGKPPPMGTRGRYQPN